MSLLQPYDLYGHPYIDSNHDDGIKHSEQLRKADLVVGLGEHTCQDEDSNLRKQEGEDKQERK